MIFGYLKPSKCAAGELVGPLRVKGNETQRNGNMNSELACRTCFKPLLELKPKPRLVLEKEKVLRSVHTISRMSTKQKMILDLTLTLVY